MYDCDVTDKGLKVPTNIYVNLQLEIHDFQECCYEIVMIIIYGRVVAAE